MYMHTHIYRYLSTFAEQIKQRRLDESKMKFPIDERAEIAWWMDPLGCITSSIDGDLFDDRHYMAVKANVVAFYTKTEQETGIARIRDQRRAKEVLAPAQ